MMHKAAILLCLVCSTVALNASEEVYAPEVGGGRYILTPPAPATPRINGPSIFGVRPDHPFLYAIPATGERPMEFSVANLPAGLSVNPENGHIAGSIESKEHKSYHVTLQAKNSKGVGTKEFRIVVGEKIGLTPPMGWNSWYCWKEHVSQENVLQSARAMAAAGLQQFGWMYINMDDGWQGKRGGKYNAVMPNAKFPDMKAMVDEIHTMGFKSGIYLTPWVGSMAGYCGGTSHDPKGEWVTDSVNGVGFKERNKYFQLGEYKFDKEDARQWADWGIDYLKDDWNISHDYTKEAMERRQKALRESGRDVFYSVSANGPISMADTYVKYSNAFRIFVDIRVDWDTRGTGAGSIRAIMDMMRIWAPYCGPGHYPDPDIMVIDGLGGGGLSKLTGDEQYTHVSLWSLWAGPLFFSSAVDKLGEFGMNLLSNPEVFEIHQDALCKMATVKNKDPQGQVWVKPLENGDTAVGLVNLSDEPRVITADWAEIGAQGKRLVRDVWRQRDIRVFEDSFSAMVPAHGTVLVRLSAPVDGVATAEAMKHLPSTPVATPDGGAFSGETTVSLKSDPDAKIHYTLDGKSPNQQSPAYTVPFPISSFTNLKAVAIKDGVKSGVTTAQFQFAPKTIPAPDIELVSLKKEHSFTDHGDVQINKTGRYEEPFKYQGKVVEKGLGMCSGGKIKYLLEPSYKRLVAMACVDDSSADDAAGRFVILIDEKVVSASPILKKGDPAWLFDVEIPKGAKSITLVCHRESAGERFLFDYLNCGFKL
jgi:alpha-galactosidase